ncbi:MAG: PAS domain-containing protein [Bacteroides sp.]|nr:PAS domain-containing protein [Bacteroides sp.]
MLWVPAESIWWAYVAIGLAVILLWLMWRSVLLPARMVMKGMDLIKAQDFNNRLLNVHEPDSDKIVDLFNQMIDKLRNERLHNREQESFLKLLIEASPMGVMMLDYDDRITMMNDSFLRLTGIKDIESVKGKTMNEVPSELARKMQEVNLGENRIIRNGDVKRYRCYHLSFIQTGFQRQFYLLESLTEEVMKAERQAYEKVIRIISHEVNNTMGGVRSVLDTIHSVCEEDDLREVIESCDNRCNEMCNFISSYADVVRVPKPVMKETDLVQMLRTMSPFLQETLPENIRLTFTPTEEKSVVSIDLSLIQQVIVNIVKNAVESIQSEGFIDISIEKLGKETQLTISNNGAPITEEVSRNLFSPFFTTKREGRGLGLTLISEILNLHNARFSLKTGADLITRFTIIFH